MSSSENDRAARIRDGMREQERDRYEILEELGRGGMAVVHRARDRKLGRFVAIKRIHPDAFPDAQSLQRFRREAEAAGRVTHPNVVAIYDVGEENGRPFLVLELVQGSTLTHLLPAKDVRPILELLVKVVAAVHHIHEQGIVHRDLKPSNILVAAGEPKVADFGLARPAEAETLTKTGSTLGTPLYMAPEQVEAKEVTPRTDVWSLGVILYEVVTGRPPFAGAGVAEIYRRIVTDDPERTKVAADLETICLKALEKEPSRRYASAAEFGADVRRYLDGQPILARPITTVERAARWVRRRKLATIAAILLVTLGAAVLVVTLQKRRTQQALDESDRRRKLQEERIKPLWGKMQATRPLFHVKEINLHARLDDIRRDLVALEADPVGDEGWVMLGMGWYFVGEEKRAEQALLRADPKNATVAYYLGRIWMERSLLLQLAGLSSVEWAERAQKTLSQDLAGIEPVDRAIAEGYRLLAEGRKAEVRTLCEESRTRFAGTLGVDEFWLLQGWATDWDERISAATKAIEAKPHGALGWFQRGTTHWRDQRPRPAVADLDRALEINPNLALAYTMRGLAHYGLGQWDAAIADQTRCFERMPDYASAPYNRALAKWGKGDRAGAMDDFALTLKLRPGWVEAWIERAGHQEDPDLAIRDLTEAIRLDPKFVHAWINRALVHQKRNRLEEAIRDYTEALAVDPKCVKAWLNRGAAHAQSGNLEKAVEDWSEALRLDPAELTARWNRAKARAKLGDREGAIADLETLLERAPADWRGRAAAEELRRQLR